MNLLRLMATSADTRRSKQGALLRAPSQEALAVEGSGHPMCAGFHAWLHSVLPTTLPLQLPDRRSAAVTV